MDRNPKGRTQNNDPSGWWAAGRTGHSSPCHLWEVRANSWPKTHGGGGRGLSCPRGRPVPRPCHYPPFPESRLFFKNPGGVSSLTVLEEIRFPYQPNFQSAFIFSFPFPLLCCWQRHKNAVPDERVVSVFQIVTCTLHSLVFEPGDPQRCIYGTNWNLSVGDKKTGFWTHPNPPFRPQGGQLGRSNHYVDTLQLWNCRSTPRWQNVSDHKIRRLSGCTMLFCDLIWNLRFR